MIVLMAYSSTGITRTGSTDRTGEIISFSDFGGGADTSPPAWYCYTDNVAGVSWVFPNDDPVPIDVHKGIATENDLFVSAVREAVILHRGPNHFSPDGVHCCVRNNDKTHRKCVTFSEC